MGLPDALLPLAEGFEDALADIGVTIPFVAPPWSLADQGVDLLAEVDGVIVAVQVKAAPTVGDVRRFEALDVGDRYKVLVGGRLSAAVRQELRDADIGYYDARGHLRLMHPPMRIDAPAPSAIAAARQAADPLASPAARDVALGLLHEPDVIERFGVRRFAAEIGRAPSLASTTLRRLREDFLVTDTNRPVVPDLFRAMLHHWKPKRTALARLPSPGEGRLNERLRLNLDLTSVDEPGWAVTDARAAALWGAPMVLSSDSPIDFYVPSARLVSLAVASLEIAPYGDGDTVCPVHV